MVMNALDLDPNRLWKGPWRYFSEETLETMKPIDQIKREGITFDEFCCIARLNGVNVKKFAIDETSEDEFRDQIFKSNASIRGKNPHHICVSFDRKALGQTGQGHYSPIGGYHKERDLALILDVARFKYPPYWVSISNLYRAMIPHDSVTNKGRGYVSIGRPSDSCSILCHITNKYEWKSFISQDQIVNESTDINRYFQTVGQKLEYVQGIVPIFDQKSMCNDHYRLIAKLSLEISGTELYQVISKNIGQDPHKILLLTLYFFSVPEAYLNKLHPRLKQELIELRRNCPQSLHLLHQEIDLLSTQISQIEEVYTDCQQTHRKTK